MSIVIEVHSFNTGVVTINYAEGSASGPPLVLLHGGVARCPVLLLQADPKAGGFLTDTEVEQGIPLLSQPTHILLEGVSHVLHNEQKEPVLQAITDFLTSL